MYCNRLKILYLMLFFFGCESIVNNHDISDNNTFEIEVFYVDYNDNQLSVYLELNDTNIESISASISTVDDNQIIDTFELINLSDYNQNIFLYEGQLLLSDDIYIYNIDIIIYFDNGETSLLNKSFTTPIKPEIIDYSVPSTYQLDPTDWTILPIDIQISNLNGLENIESVTYEVKRALNGCDGDCNYESDCNQPISDIEYQSDDTWILNYIESDNNNIYTFHVDIPMRPLNGDALYDGDGNIIFDASDCGRTGVVFFKFLVIDDDGLTDQIIDIPLEIIE